MDDHPTASDSPLDEGETLGGKYRVDRILGRGGMGLVVAATHLELQQSVAIKLMLPEVARQKECVERFLREGRAAARLRSEHVARVFDVDKLPTGEPYMVMELLDGVDLSNLVESQGPLPIEEAVDYVLQACEAVAEAHRAGIIHRDLKPANLFLARDPYGTPSIKVLDFGISKTALTRADQAASITSTAVVMGSPSYMSPEQMRSSRDVDARTDVWALGCILFELLAGKPAWPGESMADVCALVLTQDAPSLAAMRPGIPPGLQLAVSRCLARDVQHRMPSVRELAQAIAPFGSGRASLSCERIGKMMVPGAGSGSGQTCEREGRTQGAWSTPQSGSLAVRGTRRARFLWVVVGMMTLAAVVIAIAKATRSTPQVSTASGVVSDLASVPTPSNVAPISTPPVLTTADLEVVDAGPVAEEGKKRRGKGREPAVVGGTSATSAQPKKTDTVPQPSATSTGSRRDYGGRE